MVYWASRYAPAPIRPPEIPLAMGPPKQSTSPHIEFREPQQCPRATNFLNQEATFVFGTVKNNGPRPVRQIEVTLEFHDVFKQVVLRDKQRLFESRRDSSGSDHMRDFQITYETCRRSGTRPIPPFISPDWTCSKAARRYSLSRQSPLYNPAPWNWPNRCSRLWRVSLRPAASKCAKTATWLAALEGFQYEVRQQNGAALLHLWSAQRNQVRRVTRIVREDPDRLALEVSRLGRRPPGRLEFLAARQAAAQPRVAREQFRARFQEFWRSSFPMKTVVSLTAAADLEHSLSGNYVRGLLRSGSRTWAVLGAAPRRNPAIYDGLLTFGLIWLDRARHLRCSRSVAGLRLFFPQGRGRATAHRLAALAPGDAVELYEYDPDNAGARDCRSARRRQRESWLAPRRETEALLARAGSVPGARSPPSLRTPSSRTCRPGKLTGIALSRTARLRAGSRTAIFFGLGDRAATALAGARAGIREAAERFAKRIARRWHTAPARPLSRAARALAGVAGCRRSRPRGRAARSALSLRAGAGDFRSATAA